jgi:hypothetical protein
MTYSLSYPKKHTVILGRTYFTHLPSPSWFLEAWLLYMEARIGARQIRDELEFCDQRHQLQQAAGNSKQVILPETSFP